MKAYTSLGWQEINHIWWTSKLGWNAVEFPMSTQMWSTFVHRSDRYLWLLLTMSAPWSSWKSLSEAAYPLFWKSVCARLDRSLNCLQQQRNCCLASWALLLSVARKYYPPKHNVKRNITCWRQTRCTTLDWLLFCLPGPFVTSTD